MLSLLTEEPVTRHQIADLLVRALDAEQDQDVCDGLAAAYHGALAEEAEADPDGPEPIYLYNAEAQDEWRVYARKGYRRYFPKEPDDSEAYPWWPDSLKLGRYHRALVRRLANHCGMREGLRTKIAFAQYAAEHEKKES